LAGQREQGKRRERERESERERERERERVEQIGIERDSTTIHGRR